MKNTALYISEPTTDALMTKPSRKGKVISCLLQIAVSALIIFGVWFWMLYYFNLFPFHKNVVAQYDLLAQIMPFAEHFFDVMKGEASLFYTYRIGAGMDVFGTVAYCLVSPFTFLFYIFGEGNVWNTASVILPLKLTCIAMSALILIQLKFPKMNEFIAVPVALLYAFCGYTFVSNTYINWMDFLIYLPMAIPAFDYMLKTGKVRWLALVISLCIYTCFSITCFSMLVSYPAMVCYAFLCIEKGNGKRKEYLFKISLAYLCGVLAALPIMVPALLAYLASGRNTGLFDGLFNAFSVESYYRKFSYIFSDSFFVLLILYYFIKTHFTTKESRFLLVAGVFIMMPVLVDEVCLLMNMGSYMSYALRFGFLNAVYELLIACMVLEKVDFSRKSVFFTSAEKKFLKQQEMQMSKDVAPMPAFITQMEQKRLKKSAKVLAPQIVISLVMIVLAVLLTLVIYLEFCITRGFSPFDFKWLVSNADEIMQEIITASKDFNSSFAHSTGGLEGILILLAIVTLITVPSIILYETKVVSPIFIYPAMVIVLSAQFAFYNAVLVVGNAFDHIRYEEYNSLMEQVLKNEELDEYQYRIKDYNEALCDNQSFLTHTNSFCAFTSVMDSTNLVYSQYFGFTGNGINMMKSSGGSFLANCLIGNRYYFFQSEGEEESRPILDLDYLEEVAREKGFIMYKNPAAFPAAYTVPAEELTLTESKSDYFTNMQNLYTFLGGQGDVFTTYPITNAMVEQKTMTDSETGQTTDVMLVKVFIPVSGDYAFYADLADSENVRYFTNSSFSAANLTPMSEVKVYNYHKGEGATYFFMHLVGLNGRRFTEEEIKQNCAVKVITRQTIEELSRKLWERAADFKVENSFLNNRFVVHTTAKAGEQLFLNYVSLKGHTAYVNGKKVEIKDNPLKMLLVPLEEGENEVVIEYNSPYIKYAVVAFGGSLLALIAIGVVLTKFKAFTEKLYMPIAVLSVTLAVAVILAFMVYPTGVMVWKLVTGLV